MPEANKKLLVVAKYDEKFNEVLEKPLHYTEIFQSEGLEIHVKKKHSNCLPYFDKISEIISEPDYLGVNPNEQDVSFELVKCFEDNILIGIKLDRENDYVYVSTMYDITESKIKSKLNSGRLKKYEKNIDN